MHMAKINASTGKTITNSNTDVHAPHDLEPTQHSDKDGESNDFNNMQRMKGTVDDRYSDQEDMSETSDDDKADGPEEELSLVDDDTDGDKTE